jgi:GNAT superfamily N-acetyltransferase
MDEYKLTIEDDPNAADIRFLKRNLYEYNVSKTGIRDGKLVSIFLRDRARQIVGGVHGWTALQWLHVDVLWLREDARGKGHGRRLLLAAEQEAVCRGCRYAELETFSFQAPEFYLKLGYVVFGVLDGIAGKHKWYFLKKDLV